MTCILLKWIIWNTEADPFKFVFTPVQYIHTLTRGSQSQAVSSEPVKVPIYPRSCEQPVSME